LIATIPSLLIIAMIYIVAVYFVPDLPGAPEIKSFVGEHLDLDIPD